MNASASNRKQYANYMAVLKAARLLENGNISNVLIRYHIAVGRFVDYMRRIYQRLGTPI
jgi:hypothetical protein